MMKTSVPGKARQAPYTISSISFSATHAKLEPVYCKCPPPYQYQNRPSSSLRGVDHTSIPWSLYFAAAEYSATTSHPTIGQCRGSFKRTFPVVVVLENTSSTSSPGATNLLMRSSMLLTLYCTGRKKRLLYFQLLQSR